MSDAGKSPKNGDAQGEPSFADRYELIEQIGKGDFGTVWLATDTLTGREVAIKEVDLDITYVL